eukprot:2101749-Rhodomonas_salina.1
MRYRSPRYRPRQYWDICFKRKSGTDMGSLILMRRPVRPSMRISLRTRYAMSCTDLAPVQV